jgi:hypothetical protein
MPAPLPLLAALLFMLLLPPDDPLSLRLTTLPTGVWWTPVGVACTSEAWSLRARKPICTCFI